MEKWERDLIAASGNKPALVAESGKKQDEDDEDDAEDATAALVADNERMRLKLASVADILAGAGIIHNTPYSKRQWIEE